MEEILEAPEIITKHKLWFEISGWQWNFVTGDNWIRFRVGTCDGLWRPTKNAYEILAIKNSSPNNGHLDDVFEWFNHSCKRDNKVLIMREVWNKNFYRHLVEKRGFKKYRKNNLIKTNFN